MRLWLHGGRRRYPATITLSLAVSLLLVSCSGPPVAARRRVNRAFLKKFQAEAAAQTDPCHDDETDKPRQCVPDFVNAAYGVSVRASSTCGSPPSRHCHAAGAPQFFGGGKTSGGSIAAGAASGGKEICEICDSGHPARSHPPEYLTDLNNPNNQTCWASELLSPEAANSRNNVSLVLSLGKKYELTYISLQFCHQKPHSLAIYKSMDHGKSWQPFQFYSANCREVIRVV
jgi:netrin 1